MQLALCELQCPELHGGTNHVHFMVHTVFKLDDWATYNAPPNVGMPYVSQMMRHYERQMVQHSNEIVKTEMWLKKVALVIAGHAANNHVTHPVIRNYYKMISNSSFIKLELVQTHLLPTGEMVAVLKTHYLRLFQRIWRRIYSAKMKRITSHQWLRRREHFNDVFAWKMMK